jgi:hypothetical protein
MGFSQDKKCAHGFRATAWTLMIERMPGISVDVIEAQLAQGKSGPLGMGYDRAEFLVQRGVQDPSTGEKVNRPSWGRRATGAVTAD